MPPHIARMPSSGIRHIFEIALGMQGVNFLAVGEPNAPVPRHVLDAAMAAYDRDDTNYTGNAGILPLRQAIQKKLSRDNGINVSVDEIFVTHGATYGLELVMSLLLGAGDQILVPNPGYTTFTMNAVMLQAEAVPYSLLPEHGFMPDIAELEALITPATRAIIINSPSNPLGAIFPEQVLRNLLDFARRHDLWVISDEVYEAFTYGVEHVSVAALDVDDRVFSVFSLSKTYAMTGVRVGYLVTPPEFGTVLRAMIEAGIGCVNSSAQYAAIAAIEGPQDGVREAGELYRDNLAAATGALSEAGINFLQPNGAFYLWIDVSEHSGGDVASWAEDFLRRTKVALAPGSAFGTAGEGWVRVCAAADREKLLDGLSHLPAPAPRAT